MTDTMTTDDVTTLRILTKARQLLTTPGAWCQGRTHVIKDGTVVARDLVTALLDAAQGMGMQVPASDANKVAYQMVWDATGSEGIIKFNDHKHTTQPLVLFCLDACIYVAQRHANAPLLVARDVVEQERRNAVEDRSESRVTPFAELYGATT